MPPRTALQAHNVFGAPQPGAPTGTTAGNPNPHTGTGFSGGQHLASGAVNPGYTPPPPQVNTGGNNVILNTTGSGATGGEDVDTTTNNQIWNIPGGNNWPYNLNILNTPGETQDDSGWQLLDEDKYNVDQEQDAPSFNMVEDPPGGWDINIGKGHIGYEGDNIKFGADISPGINYIDDPIGSILGGEKLEANPEGKFNFQYTFDKGGPVIDRRPSFGVHKYYDFLKEQDERTGGGFTSRYVRDLLRSEPREANFAYDEGGPVGEPEIDQSGIASLYPVEKPRKSFGATRENVGEQLEAFRNAPHHVDPPNIGFMGEQIPAPLFDRAMKYLDRLPPSERAVIEEMFRKNIMRKRMQEAEQMQESQSIPTLDA